MTFALLAGSVTAAVAALTAWWWRRAPTRLRCPRCGKATAEVKAPPLVEPSERLVRRRWCPGCGWKGLGRSGPEWIPGRPSAHGSGFHWGDERFPRDFGFEWAEDGPAELPDRPPAHPSGFRFSPDPEPRAPGIWSFQWADDPAGDAGRSELRAEGGGEAATDSRGEVEGSRPRFRWRSPEDPRGPRGFYWKEG